MPGSLVDVGILILIEGVLTMTEVVLTDLVPLRYRGQWGGIIGGLWSVNLPLPSKRHEFRYLTRYLSGLWAVFAAP